MKNLFDLQKTLGAPNARSEKPSVDSILLGEALYLLVSALPEYKNIHFAELNSFSPINFIRPNSRFLSISLLNVLVIKNCYLSALFIIELQLQIISFFCLDRNINLKKYRFQIE